jgi:hypothetical protein
VGFENWVTSADPGSVRARCGRGRHDGGDDCVPCVFAAAPGIADAHPVRPRWCGEGCRDTCARPPGGGTPPTVYRRDLQPADRVVLAALSWLLQRPGWAALFVTPGDPAPLAPTGDRLALELPARPAWPASGRPARAGPGAARRAAQNPTQGHRRIEGCASRLGPSGGGQQRMEDPQPGRHRPRVAALRADVETVSERSGARGQYASHYNDHCPFNARASSHRILRRMLLTSTPPGFTDDRSSAS